MTASERAELASILDDLHEEEADQQAERGHASNRLLRAAARLHQLLETDGRQAHPADAETMLAHPSPPHALTGQHL